MTPMKLEKKPPEGNEKNPRNVIFLTRHVIPNPPRLKKTKTKKNIEKWVK